ncbi:hypothetical protein FQN54_002339 [Arachnomyces sp. PD_36]|nr:hypothetical protein FQN54_002339 [Arachnomyces sp. PD_36]
MALNPPSKRKPTSQPNPHLSASNNRKRAKTQDARTLAVQSSEAALSKTGELDVAAFVAAREFEIRALESGVQKSKSALSTRAFQKVPRHLRRRTASHNVKRVPSRLRARARREMIEDNTPTVTARRRKPSDKLRLRLETARRLQSLNARTKAKRAARKLKNKPTEGEHQIDIAPRVPKLKKYKLSHPPTPDAKYKKRQLGKSWLPTHLYHAKRAHLTEPKEPLWRFAVPLTPTEKCYRSTHRASGSRGAVAWDMSYMSTIGLEGTEGSLENMLKGLGIDGDNAWGKGGRRWRQGTRSLEAWTRESDEGKQLIAPVTLIWQAPMKEEEVEMTDVGVKKAKKKPEPRRIFMRVHPSAFLQLWQEVLKLSKAQKPPVMVEDLRFELGSIDITGPGSSEALIAALRPIGSTEWPKDSPEATWLSLSGVNSAAALPPNALLAFNISDPRLRHPPQTVKLPSSESSAEDLARLLCSWPPDSSLSRPSIFSRPDRLTACRLLPSQKAINRRRTLATPGEHPAPKPTDPNIPVLIHTSRSRVDPKTNHPLGVWTVILPWKCVLPVWYSIMYYPLSSGGNPRFGGLQEKQQLSFEAREPWFPGDFPASKAGWTWELRERETRRKEWERKPKGKRTEFDSLDLGAEKKGEIGIGWGCDWERLIQGPPKELEDKKKSTRVESEDASLPDGGVKLPSDSDKPQPSTADKDDTVSFPGIIQLSATIASSILTPNQKPPLSQPKINSLLNDKPALATVRVTAVLRGTPTPRARIYRLPREDPALREKWLSLDPASKPKGQKPGTAKNSRKNTSDNDDNNEALPIPGEEDLIGFITTGNYNLHEGQGTGIGSIWVQRVLDFTPSQAREERSSAGKGVQNIKKGGGRERRLCIIRAAGERLGRLGIWEIA